MMDGYTIAIEMAIEDNIVGGDLWFVYTEMANRNLRETDYLLKSGGALHHLQLETWSNVYRKAQS